MYIILILYHKFFNSSLFAVRVTIFYLYLNLLAVLFLIKNVFFFFRIFLLRIKNVFFQNYRLYVVSYDVYMKS